MSDVLQSFEGRPAAMAADRRGRTLYVGMEGPNQVWKSKFNFLYPTV